jgi:hypothetical protein
LAEQPAAVLVRPTEVEADGLVARRHKYVDTALRPLLEDAFIDDWSPIAGFPLDYLIVFERTDGQVRGLRVSGDRVRGLWFERIGD